MLVQKQTHINMVELVIWAILLLAAAAALIIGVGSSDWLAPPPQYNPVQDPFNGYGFVSALSLLF